MRGETSDRIELTAEAEMKNPVRAVQRKLARAQLVLGIPAMLAIAFGLLLGYRWASRSLMGPVFWLVLVPLLGVFGVYYVQVFLLLRRSGQD